MVVLWSQRGPTCVHLNCCTQEEEGEPVSASQLLWRRSLPASQLPQVSQRVAQMRLSASCALLPLMRVPPGGAKLLVQHLSPPGCPLPLRELTLFLNPAWIVEPEHPGPPLR